MPARSLACWEDPRSCLRRTAATRMAESGEMDEVIDAILNHAKQGIIKVYNQYRHDKKKQAALESWARKLQSIVSSKAAGTVEVPQINALATLQQL